MARMSRKLERTLSAKLLPVVLDRASAIEAREEARAWFPELRADVSRYASMTERARLARVLSEVAEWSLLLGEIEGVRPLLDEALALLAVDERHAPMQLMRGRIAWAMILEGGSAPEARALLTTLLEDSDPSVAAWQDSHLLYLAAACYQDGDVASAREALDAAMRFYERQPRRDATLLRQALDALADA